MVRRGSSYAILEWPRLYYHKCSSPGESKIEGYTVFFQTNGHPSALFWLKQLKYLALPCLALPVLCDQQETTLINVICSITGCNSPISQLSPPPPPTHTHTHTHTITHPHTRYFSCTATSQLYSNISQILLLYKTRGIITIVVLRNHRGFILQICQNTTMWVYGAWIRIYYALFKKTYSTSSNVF